MLIPISHPSLTLVTGQDHRVEACLLGVPLSGLGAQRSTGAVLIFLGSFDSQFTSHSPFLFLFSFFAL